MKDPTKWGVQVIEDYALKRDDYADFSRKGTLCYNKLVKYKEALGELW